MTRVYGSSDDLIECSGDICGEVGAYGTDDANRGVLLVFSDGTIFEVKYCKGSLAVWGISVLKNGSLLDRVEPCDDEDAEIYSDQAFFRDGLKWAYAAKRWERVQ